MRLCLYKARNIQKVKQAKRIETKTKEKTLFLTKSETSKRKIKLFISHNDIKVANSPFSKFITANIYLSSQINRWPMPLSWFSKWILQYHPRNNVTIHLGVNAFLFFRCVSYLLGNLIVCGEVKRVKI